MAVKKLCHIPVDSQASLPVSILQKPAAYIIHKTHIHTMGEVQVFDCQTEKPPDYVTVKGG